MRRTPVDKLARAGRLVLLAGSVLALFTLGAWTLRPEWIEDWDASLVEAHLAGPTDRIEAAEAIRGKDPARSIELSEELLADLGGVEPGDRLDPVVRRTLQNVVLNHRRLDQLEEAAEACERWVAFDPNNLRARAQLGEILLELPGRRAEGLRVLEELFRTTPQVGYVAGPWVAALVAEGRPLEAVDAALASDRLALANSWTVSWMDGRPRKTTRRARLTPMLSGDELALEFTLQGPVASMRIELPHGAPLTLVDPVLEIESNRKQIALVFADEEVGLIKMAQSGRSFTQLDTGAFFQVPLPHTIKSSRVDFVFRAQRVRNPAPALEVLAFHPDLESVLAALDEAGRAGDAELLRDARRRNLATQKLQVYWHKDSSFSGKRANTQVVGGLFRDGRLHFDTALAVDAPASHLRLDFPDGVGTIWSLERIAVVAGPQREELEIELGDALPVLKSLDRDGRTFTVTGVDPHFGFEIPIEKGKVHALLVQGWAR